MSHGFFHRFDLHPEKLGRNFRIPSLSLSGNSDNKDMGSVLVPPDISLLDLPLSVYLENTNAGIFVTDRFNTLLWVNQVFFDASGIGEEGKAILGKPLDESLAYLKLFVEKPRIFIKRV